MPRSELQRRGRPGRTVSLKWVLVAATGLVVIMAAAVTTVLVIDRGRDEDRRAAAAAAGDSTAVTSPYDLTELPEGADLDLVKKAAFVSIFMPNESGTLTSYGVNSDLPAARALIEAVKNANEVDPDVAAAALGNRMAQSRLTFVLPSRETLTFAMYLEQGMIARDADVWRPEGDLAALVQAAITGQR